MARIATVEEVVPYTAIRDRGKTDPTFLQDALDSAESTCERYCGRTFSPLPPLATDGTDTNPPVAKTFVIRGQHRRRLPDLRVVTSITLDGITLEPDIGYYLDAYQEPATEITLTRIAGSPGVLTITGRWGFLAPPVEIKTSILKLAGRMWAQKQAQWADQIVGEGGSAFIWSSAVPRDILAVWDLFRPRNFAIV